MVSKIRNIPRNNFFLYRKIRELLEHRAMWLYLTLNEAEKKGLDYDFAKPGVFHCGCIQGLQYLGGDKKKSLKTLKKNLFSRIAQKIFEMKVLESTDDKLSIDFHYCPLVKAWQKLGCSDEQIEKLCDVAMEGDRGIASCFDGEMNLGKVISKGDSFCEVRFSKNLK
ncbi:L-2-amino-thiazoline-4-carboxylic acid hydrolase [bacterium]|nr:L-2-amino-thiazoline-4-carboxylic acid hydrolase [bacterium]